jgi:hypothetical protein
MKWAAWTKCAIISSTSGDFALTAGSFGQKLSRVPIEVVEWISASPGMVTTQNLERLRSTHVRVVVVLMPCADLQAVAVLAGRLGMLQQGWGWIEFGESILACESSGDAHMGAEAVVALQGWIYLEPISYTTPSSLQALEAALSGGASTSQYDFGADEMEVVQSGSASTIQYDFGADQIPGRLAANLYDAVYLFAHAADALLRQGMALNHRGALVQQLKNTTFMGLSGRVTLDSQGVRVEQLGIMNYLGRSNATMIGNWSDIAGFSRLLVQYLVWPGGAAEIPSAEGVHA